MASATCYNLSSENQLHELHSRSLQFLIDCAPHLVLVFNATTASFFNMSYPEEKKTGVRDSGYHVEQAYTTVDEQETTRRASEVLLNHENLSYGSSGLKGIIESPYVCAAAFLASMGGFSFGYGMRSPLLVILFPR